MMKASSNTLCLWICKINQELVNIVLPTDNKELFSFITETYLSFPISVLPCRLQPPLAPGWILLHQEKATHW